MLEHMPVSLDVLLDNALLDLENNREYANMQEIINLFYLRYNEIKEYNSIPDEYHNSLLLKIKQLECDILDL
jgi:hypothetical protein